MPWAAGPCSGGASSLEEIGHRIPRVSVVVDLGPVVTGNQHRYHRAMRHARVDLVSDMLGVLRRFTKERFGWLTVMVGTLGRLYRVRYLVIIYPSLPVRSTRTLHHSVPCPSMVTRVPLPCWEITLLVVEALSRRFSTWLDRGLVTMP